MGSKHKKSKLEKAEIKAKNFFDKWRSTGSYCPYFKEQVAVTRLLWNHLLNDRRRTKVEKMERLSLLPLAKKLLESTTTCQNHRPNGKFCFWAFHANLDGTNVKIVVSSKGINKKKYLLSVMKY